MSFFYRDSWRHDSLNMSERSRVDRVAALGWAITTISSSVPSKSSVLNDSLMIRLIRLRTTAARAQRLPTMTPSRVNSKLVCRARIVQEFRLIRKSGWLNTQSYSDLWVKRRSEPNDADDDTGPLKTTRT